MDSFDKLINHINQASYILIAGHISPDGDSIGACCAMGFILEQMNKKYTILLDNPDSKYNFLLDKVTISQEMPPQKADLFIALDCGDKDRLGQYEDAHDKAKVTWNIDHHISNPKFSKYNYVNHEASSASEIVYEFFEQSKLDLNVNIAKAIYTGIVYDTARFRHSNTTSRTLNIASKLIAEPFDFSLIIQKIFIERPIESIQLQALAVSNIESYNNNSLIVSTLSLEEITSYTNNEDDTGGIVNTLKNIENSKIALFLYEKASGEIKVSIRSEDPYDICKVAEQWGGGGHKKAAGATVIGQLKEVKRQIVSDLLELL